MNKLVFGTALALVLGIVGQTKADQIPIAVSGFNEHMVVNNFNGGNPAVTATMDGGTTLVGFAWYRQGYNAGAPSTGLMSGIQTSLADPTTQLLLQPFTGNDTMLVDGTHGGTLSLTNPGRYSTLSFFASTGSAFATPSIINYTLHFADGSTLSGTFSAPDWFGNSPTAIIANGRTDATGSSFFDVNSGNPRIYQENIGLIPSSSALTSIDLSLNNGLGSAHTAVFAVSGTAVTAVPEPAAIISLGLGAVGLVGYTWRRRKQV